MIAIVGPRSIYMSDIVASLCNELNIPHIDITQRTREVRKNLYHKFTRNISPDSQLLSKSLVDVIRAHGWKKFGIVYDSDESLTRLNGIIQMYSFGFQKNSIYKFPKNRDIKPILKQILKTYEHHVILDCNLENLAEFFRQGSKLNLTTAYMV